MPEEYYNHLEKFKLHYQAPYIKRKSCQMTAFS